MRAVIAGLSIITGITTVALCARLYIHWSRFSRLYWDDLLVVIAWALSIPLTMIAVLGQSPESTLHGQLFFSRPVAQAFFYTSLWSIKFAFLVFFRRLGFCIFYRLRIYWKCTLVFTLLTYVILWAINPYKCWAEKGILGCTAGPTYKNMAITTISIATVFDVLTDLLIMAIPLSTTSKLRLSRRNKFILYTLFSLVLITTAVSIARMVMTISALSSGDKSYAQRLRVLTQVEVSTAIIVACVCSFRTIFTDGPGSQSASSNKRSYSSQPKRGTPQGGSSEGILLSDLQYLSPEALKVPERAHGDSSRLLDKSPKDDHQQAWHLATRANRAPRDQSKPQHPFLQDVFTCPKEDVENTTQPQEQRSLWSHTPFCTGKRFFKYCAHTTSSARSPTSHGLSIIALPPAAAAVAHIFHAANDTPTDASHAYTIRDIPNKGKGLVASRPIARGSTLLLDSPRLIASQQFPTHVTQSGGHSLFSHAVAQLPAADRALVLSLDQSLGGSAIEDVMKTNAFVCNFADSGVGDTYMCLFPGVARINHACRPNAHARFLPRSLRMQVRATADITAGEEITISYGSIELPYAERQTLYREGWGFECGCALCISGAESIARSDARRGRFKELRDAVGGLTAQTFDAQRVVEWEEEILGISQEEGFEGLVAEDLERLAYVATGLGRRDEARRWAGRAGENLLFWKVVEGEEPGAQVRRVEGLLRELG
ncbi:hypothetical protein BDV95DRAFT_589883 [Massariosphaeria phaeospora]|uniref:SET domain-containing protein n=1 Tax=Massariosphaeria phaeospora TaxID=100035 RepID=A0A7C8MJR3_9PLEO|nr:hypothetical protein BDV95DRAFT_589883 [Massariosphaeria phaeospora]